MSEETTMDRVREVLRRKFAMKVRKQVIPKAEEMNVKSAAVSLADLHDALGRLVPNKKVVGEAAKLGLGGAAVGIPATYWYMNQAPADPEALDPVTDKPLVTNWDKLIGDLSVRNALWRTQREPGSFMGPDLEVSSGLHRVAIPKSRLKEEALKYLRFRPTVIAVPERGQDRLTTWRQFDTAGHLHSHGPEKWLIHKDKWPALNMVLNNPKSQLSFGEKLEEGVKHVTFEGLQGYMSYLQNLITNPPTMPEIIQAKKNPGKYPEVDEWLRKQKEAEQLQMLAMQQEKTGSAYEELKVKIGPAELTVEVADDDRKRTLGLGGREKIAEDRGMLFSPAGSYWMKGCNFDLDLLYINKEAEVCDIQSMNASDKEKIYEPNTVDEPILAIEAPAGWCKKNGVKIGHKLT